MVLADDFFESLRSHPRSQRLLSGGLRLEQRHVLVALSVW